MSETKLCKECKHCVTTFGVSARYAKCHAPNQYDVSRVTGERIYMPEISMCEVQRMSSRLGTCGLSARWFEQKEADKSPWWRFWQ